MSVTVKVNWSGGKDSTLAVLKHLSLGHNTKVVNYIPMLVEGIPLIQKEHYEFILSTADYFRSHGATVYLVSGLTYFDYVTHVSQKGKFKGQIFGFPYGGRGRCGFKRDSKLKALNSVDVGYFDYQDIAIAFDEKSRSKILNSFNRSILFEKEITEHDAYRLVNALGFLSPQYSLSFRDGCVLCPFAKDCEIAKYFDDYPDAVPIVSYLQDRVRSERPDRMSPRYGGKMFL